MSTSRTTATGQMTDGRDPFAVRRQQAAALAKGNGYRSQRAELRRESKRRTPSVGAERVRAILLAPPECMATITVERLIRSIHGFGAVKATQIAGRSKSKRLCDLRDSERARIADECTRRAADMVMRALPTAPNPTQASHALQTATRVRLARVEARREITGDSDPAARAAALIADPGRDPDLDGMTVQSVLEAIPRVGETRTRKILGMLAMNAATTLAGLSPARAKQLATIVTLASEPRVEAHPAVIALAA
jgi:ribosomal protein S13